MRIEIVGVKDGWFTNEWVDVTTRVIELRLTPRGTFLILFKDEAPRGIETEVVENRSVRLTSGDSHVIIDGVNPTLSETQDPLRKE